MKFYKYMVMTVLGLLAPNASAEDATYLCIIEEATGFYYKNGAWGRANFNVSDEKYILRKIKETEYGFKDKKNPYGVFKLGGKIPEFRCLINEYSNDFICHVGVAPGQFFFSPDSGRFIST